MVKPVCRGGQPPLLAAGTSGCQEVQMVLKQLVNAFLPLASCQLLAGLLAATYLHTALTGCVVSRRPAFLL